MNDSYGTRSLREIARILFRHWFLLVLIVAIGGVGTWVVCEYFAPRHYRSSIDIIFKRPQNKNPLATDSGERMLEVFVKAQQQIVMSDVVVARAKVIAEDPTLRQKWLALQKEWERVTRAGERGADAPQQKIVEFLTDAKKSPVPGQVDDLLNNHQSDFNKFRNSIKLETPGGEQVAMTETFTISVDRPGPRTEPDSYLNAQYAADILADMYLFRYQQLQQELNNPAASVMSDVVAEFRKQLDDKMAAYQAFIQKNPADIGVLEQLLKSGTEHGVQVVLSKIREGDAALYMQLARDKAMYNVLKKSLPAGALEPGGVAAMTDEEVSAAIAGAATDFFKDDVAYIEQIKNIATLQTRAARIETQYMEESRDLRYIHAQLARARRQQLDTIVAFTKGLAGSVAAREEQKAMNAALIEETSEEQKGIHSKLAQYARLKNDFEVAQKQLERLEQDKIDADSAKLISHEAITISKLDAASTPDPKKPIVPLTGIYTAVAVVVSLLLGLALVFLADHYDHTLRSTLEAERYLGVPVLGSVKKRGRGLIVSG